LIFPRCRSGPADPTTAWWWSPNVDGARSWPSSFRALWVRWQRTRQRREADGESGAPVKMELAHVLTMRDGKAARIAEYFAARKPSKPPGSGSRRHAAELCRWARLVSNQRPLACEAAILRGSETAGMKAKRATATAPRFHAPATPLADPRFRSVVGLVPANASAPESPAKRLAATYSRSSRVATTNGTFAGRQRVTPMCGELRTCHVASCGCPIRVGLPGSE
jgi:hypothetical protein